MTIERNAIKDFFHFIFHHKCAEATLQEQLVYLTCIDAVL